MGDVLSRPIAGGKLTPRAAAAIVAAVGTTAGVGGIATGPAVQSRWYRRLRKPDWQPPGAVFGPVWSVLYALIAASMLDVRHRRGGEDRGVWVLYGGNLALNLAPGPASTSRRSRSASAARRGGRSRAGERHSV